MESKTLHLWLVVVLLLGSGLAACVAPQSPASPIPSSTSAPTPVATLSPLPVPTAKPTAIPTATVPPLPAGLYVDAGKDLGKVSRFVFGTNHGPWTFLNPEVMPQFDESGLTLIRFPGGNWGDQNNLEAWQIDPFITLVRQINAEPLFCARLSGGTPEQAVALLRYTIQQGYNVRYWSIGNEPNLYSDYTTEQFNADWRKFALALKAVDPKIILVGPDTSQFTGDSKSDPRDSAGRDWLREFLKANGDLVDIVAVHRYPFPTQINERPTRAELFANTAQWDSIPINLRAAVRETTGRDLPIAITEFNSSWAGTIGGETGMDTFNNALWLGDVLGRLIRQRVDMLAQFTLQSNPNVGGYGIFARYDPRPSYYTYQMYKDFGSALVYAQSDQTQLSLYAARQGDALTLMFVNLSDQAITRPLTIDHFTVSGDAQVKRFDETHRATKEASIAIKSGTEYTFPPASMILFTIPGKVNGQ